MLKSKIIQKLYDKNQQVIDLLILELVLYPKTVSTSGFMEIEVMICN